MGHIERHIGKTDEELTYRLLQDWKEFSATLYDDMMPILEDIKTQKNDNDIFKIKFDKPVGYGFDRFFQKRTSNILKVVFKDGELITAYPDLENGTLLAEKYNFDLDKFKKLCTETEKENINTLLFDKFINLINNEFEVRFVMDTKHPQIRISIDNYMLKITDTGNLVLIDNIVSGTHKEYNQNILTKNEIKTLSPEDILKIARLIKSQINNHDLFSINDKRNILEKSIEKFKNNEIKQNRAR